MHRKLKVAAAASLVLGAVALPASSASAAPNKACPSAEAGWFLVPPSPGDQVVDRNGDGLICVKGVNGRGSSRDVPGFTVRDDLIFLI